MASPLQGFVRTSRLAGKPGDIADNMFNDKMSYTNDDPRAQQSDTITVGGVPAEDDTYTVKVNGIDITSAPLGAAPTTTDAANAIRLAIASEPLVNGTVLAEAAAAVVTTTARVGGVGYTISEAEADLTLASVQANATADAIEFGRAVISAGLSSGSNKLAKAVNSTDVTDTASADSLIVGVTLRDLTEMMAFADGESANYAGGSAMGVMRDGRLYVEIEADLSDVTDDVYVRTTVDGSLDKIGGFAPAAGTGLVLWSNAKWVRQAGSGLAVLEIDL